MWRRICLGIGAFASLAVWQLAGCGSETSPDIGGDGGNEASLTDGGAAFPDAPVCAPAGTACSSNNDCCSVVCDPKAKQCVAGAGPGNCKPGGAACGNPSECCNLLCQNGTCGLTACIPDNASCTDSTQCCGGNCTSGKCVPLNTTCKTSGNGCSSSAECCSKLCNNGFCQIGSSFCTQNGDVCSTGSQCCGGLCNKASGATLGTCGAPPAGATFCNGGIDGTVCTDCTACCSRLCAPYLNGVKVCQPANGCHIDGDLCTKNTDCCGGDPKSGLPGAGNVTCEIQAGFTIGICRNPESCNPEGNVCHYLNYACGSSSAARNDCCDHLGVNTDCTLDAVGVPRCHVIGADGGQACRQAGQTCAFSGDCCSGNPCVPNGSGELVCSSTACSPVTGPCTVNADCCPGNYCVVPPGSTQGTCNATPGSGGTDAGTTTTDSGTTGTDATTGGGGCSLYGQGCQTNTDCCNGVPCTFQGQSFCAAGQSGCTCVSLIPR